MKNKRLRIKLKDNAGYVAGLPWKKRKGTMETFKNLFNFDFFKPTPAKPMATFSDGGIKVNKSLLHFLENFIDCELELPRLLNVKQEHHRITIIESAQYIALKIEEGALYSPEPSLIRKTIEAAVENIKLARLIEKGVQNETVT